MVNTGQTCMHVCARLRHKSCVQQGPRFNAHFYYLHTTSLLTTTSDFDYKNKMSMCCSVQVLCNKIKSSLEHNNATAWKKHFAKHCASAIVKTSKWVISRGCSLGDFEVLADTALNNIHCNAESPIIPNYYYEIVLPQELICPTSFDS